MNWQNFLQHLGLGLLALLIATSAAIVPPWALPALWAKVDTVSQIGILGVYGLLFFTVFAYACWAARNKSAEVSYER